MWAPEAILQKSQKCNAITHQKEQQSQSHFKSDKEFPIIKPPTVAHQSSSKVQQSNKQKHAAKSAPNQQSHTPSFRQLKQFYVTFQFQMTSF